MKETLEVDGGARRRERENVDRLFEVLANGHRRRILTRLLDADRLRIGGDGSVGDDDHGFDDAGQQLALFHVHLPKLHEWEFVEWDGTRGVVTAGRRFSDIAPLVRFLREDGTVS